jgi:hypothetical protein
MLANPSLTIHAGTDLLGGGVVSLGGTTTLNVDTTKVPQLNTANTFTGNQTVNGNISATGVVSAGAYNIGSDLFSFGSKRLASAFLGFSGNQTTTGDQNTAVGGSALAANTTGSDNVAAGVGALASNTTGTFNTAIGSATLFDNTTGWDNTAVGELALDDNATGADNTAVGAAALLATTGSDNSAVGGFALGTNTTGSGNSALGSNAGARIAGFHTTGSNNTFLGSFSGSCCGGDSTGSNDTFVGTSTSTALTDLNNTTAIGARAEVDQSNSLVLGSINGVNAATADTNVGIGTTTPAARLHIGPANSTGLRIEGPSTAGYWGRLRLSRRLR